MAQVTNLSVENGTFPSVRADINDTLLALFSNNSDNNPPSATVAFQDWINTTDINNKIWYKRNAADNAWIKLATITGNTIAFEGTLPDQSGNAGEYLKTDGTDATWEPIVSGINAADVFASSGNWTCPAGVQKVLVMVIGGGGGGQGNRRQSTFSSAGNSGGAGGYGAGILAVTPGTTYTVTVGAGGAGTAGAASSVAATATAGGTSTFETISATGGNGGGGTAGAVAASGSCSSADATLRRSNVSAAIPFLVNGTISTRDSSSPAALQWAVTSSLSPGSRGIGGAYSTTVFDSGAGGVGGAVLLLY
jgi:hypothetical protein